jgi:hypothetical protein
MTPPPGARYTSYNSPGGRPTHSNQGSKGSYTHGTYGSSAGSAADVYLGAGDPSNYGQTNSKWNPPYTSVPTTPYAIGPNTPRRGSASNAEKDSSGRTYYDLGGKSSMEFSGRPQVPGQLQAPAPIAVSSPPATATSTAIAITGTAAIAAPGSGATFGSGNGYGRIGRPSESTKPYGSGRPSEDYQTSIAPPARKQRTEKPPRLTHAALSL